jgi:HSP20 family molecular chaperone IbpA
MQLGDTPTPPGFGLRRQIDRIVGDAFSRKPRDRRRTPWVPAMAVHDGEDELSLSLELPGISFADVDIQVHDRVLTVCERTQPATGTPPVRHGVPERRDILFSQSVPLPPDADAREISAQFAGDVLVVRVPRRRTARPEITAHN